MGSSGGGQFRTLSVVCLHNNAIVARGILVTILHFGTPEPRLSVIYIVSSFGTSLSRSAIALLIGNHYCFSGAIYLTTIIASMAQNGAVPLYYELVCEIVYPVSEGIANMVLTLMNNITGLIFTLVLVIPNIGEENESSHFMACYRVFISR